MATIPLKPEPSRDRDEEPAPPPFDGPAIAFQGDGAALAHAYQPEAPQEARAWWKRLSWLRNLALFVLLPTSAVGLFVFGVTADQYQSETHFVLRSPGNPGPATSGLGQLLGMENNPASADGQTVVDYLLSHDAVASLEHSIDLSTMFRRPEADWFSRLPEDAPPETLLRYYRDMVHIELGHDAGITRVEARAFRGADARRLAEALLEIGERRVNEFNRRLLESRLLAARESLDAAEVRVGAAQGAVDALRRTAGDIDPERTGASRIAVQTQMEAELAQARAKLNAMGRSIRKDSPQYESMAAQVRALEQQMGAARANLTGSAHATANSLGRYEGLQRSRDMAAKRYEAAAAALDAARDQALRQQLYLVRVVEPNLPQKALYPKRIKLIATVFFALLIVYAIGWLIFAGVREHAA